MKEQNGYVQIYTGTGKGKTTAALGLTLRAAGAGLRIFIGQFLKSGAYSEIKGLSYLGDAVTIEQYGGEKFIIGEPSKEDIALAEQGFDRVKSLSESDEYDIIVLEEINVAVDKGLIALENVLQLIQGKHPSVELVLTGRNAPEKLIEAADLVTEMRCVKHYMDIGVYARTGIEK